ncbi:MAG: tRNA pseudouridine(55) synthase TruB [Clostridia bacterium]|nr:tRNA pseudouridine(55) synthase TruB [Clostridia bacterium]
MDGIINVYKSAGMTSFDVVYRIRKIAGTKKVGHTGTLDPDAEGVLPICINRGTKAAGMLTMSDKRYTAEFKLGITTDTQDIGGKVLRECNFNISESELINTIGKFVGEIEQVPPMFSAIKVNGKKLYDLARKGVSVKREPRKIKIYDIKLLYFDGVIFKIDIKCSKGTYIRTLGNDIGEKLGCGAVMTKLVRTQSSIFKIEKAVKLENLTSSNFNNYVTMVDELFDYEKIIVKGEDLKRVLNGNPVTLTGIEDGRKYRVYDDNNKFLSISYAEGNMLKIEKLFYVGE